MIKTKKIVSFTRIVFSFFFLLLTVFLGIIDIFLISSEVDDTKIDSKKNSSLAWGNTHDDGWID